MMGTYFSFFFLVSSFRPSITLSSQLGGQLQNLLAHAHVRPIRHQVCNFYQRRSSFYQPSKPIAPTRLLRSKSLFSFSPQYSPTRFLIALHTFLNADPIFNLCCTLIFCALLLHVYVIVRKSSRESLAVIGSLSQHINWIDDTNTSFDFGSKYCVHSDRSLPSSFFSNSRNQFSVSRLENLEAWDECDVQRCVRTHCYYFNVPFYTFCLFPCLFKQINDLVSSKSYLQATINEDICNTLEIWHKCFLKLLR